MRLDQTSATAAALQKTTRALPEKAVEQRSQVQARTSRHLPNGGAEGRQQAELASAPSSERRFESAGSRVPEQNGRSLDIAV